MNNHSSVIDIPSYCEYAGGSCDQQADSSDISDSLFLYPSEPRIIASTIEEAIQSVKSSTPGKRWSLWKDIGVVGQIIFCEICKSIKLTKIIVADVKTWILTLMCLTILSEACE